MRTKSRIKAAWVRVFQALVPLFSLAAIAHAQFTAPYVVLQGTLTTASGTPAKNAVLTLTPSQVFFVAGSQVVVGTGQCYTDVSGSLHGLPTPASPRVTPQGGVGTLPASNYYVKFAWYDQWGAITLTSPEVAVQLLVTGELQILPPVGNGPPNAVGMKVYIGTTPGSETLQGSTNTTTGQFTQSVPLVTGAAQPIQNLTSCAYVANDAGWPTGTGYMAALIDASGNPLFTYPEMWQLLSPGSTYNLSNGIPYYHGQVTYPVPILTVPYNHNPQSISGPVSFTNYNIYNIGAVGVGTALPAWGVDVEGAGLLGQINAAGGYLVNGNGGSIGQCIISDGTSFNTPANCVTALPTIYYQTVLLNGTGQTPRLGLNFTSNFAASDSASPSRTTIDLSPTGISAGACNQPNSITFDLFGRASGCSSGGGTTPVTRTCTGTPGTPPYQCYTVAADGTKHEWGTSSLAAGGSPSEVVTLAYPLAFSTLPSPNVSPVSAPAGGGGPCTGFKCPVTCNAISSSLTTSGASVGLSVGEVLGSGFANLSAGDYCQFDVWGN